MTRFIVCVAAVAVHSLLAQTDWPAYGHDPGGMRYSPLTQITPANVSKLVRAWTYHARADVDSPARLRFTEVTPLVVDDLLYITTPFNQVVALDPETGKEIWNYRTARGALPIRGVAYWPGDHQLPPAILCATTQGYLIALNARTGKPVHGFGSDGEVDLRKGVTDSDAGVDDITSPPTIYNDLVIQPDRFTASGPEGGDIRAWNARTGAFVWRFHTIPRDGEPGSESWNGTLKGGVSAWGLITVDTDRGILYVPLKQSASDFYGGERRGANLYGTSLVALNANTGKMLWYFQFVHHDIWDYDAAAPPALFDVIRNGRKIPAVAEITKTGLLYIFNRVTGKPLFGVEERPVPKGDVPGEEYSPTQPFPLKPLPLARNSFSLADITEITPEQQRYCTALFEQQKMHGGPAFTPYGTGMTIVFPGTLGSGNWGGLSFDPRLGYIFVNTQDLSGVGRMVPAGDNAGYTRVGPPGPNGMLRFMNPGNMWPCQKPPWGRLIAVNANTGAIAWNVALGVVDELEAKGIHNTGALNLGGSIATAGGLVFIGATVDNRFRAFDSRTGRELWLTDIQAGGHSVPITYRGRDGKQYVVIAASGQFYRDLDRSSDAIEAFTLP
jgi:glucose dehydrogenase